jgi:hypothetical protein
MINFDRPIMFSAAMVSALRDGRKTVTRRLETSPMAKVLPGDRLWVRENFRLPERDGEPWYEADGEPADGAFGKLRPCIHMPRRLSRFTLPVRRVTLERLQQITDAEAIAEGITEHPGGGWHVPGVAHPNKAFPYLSRPTPREMYAALWDALHGSGKWGENPVVGAITFDVHQVNIDALALEKEAA